MKITTEKLTRVTPSIRLEVQAEIPQRQMIRNKLKNPTDKLTRADYCEKGVFVKSRKSLGMKLLTEMSMTKMKTERSSPRTFKNDKNNGKSEI